MARLDLEYTGFHWDDALRAMDTLVPVFVPGHTEQDPRDPINLWKRMHAARAHRDASLMDRVAEDLYSGTCQSRAGFVAIGGYIGHRLQRESPATAVVVAKLTSAVSVAASLLVPEGSTITTQGDGDPVVAFTADEEVRSGKTSFAGSANDAGEIFLYDSAGAVWVDVNDSGGPAIYPTGVAGDAIYFGHPDLMFRALVFVLANHDVNEPAVWETYDEDFVFAPGGAGGSHASAVVDNGDGTLTMRVDVYAGANTRYDDGAFQMEVLCHATGWSEMALVTWDVANSRATILTSSLLGQTVPTTERTGYSVRPLWVTPANLSDGTSSGSGMPFGQDGTVTFDLPYAPDTDLQTGRKWESTEVNGATCWWLRCRKTNGGGGGSSDLTTVQADSLDQDPWWVQIPVVQGELIEDALDDGLGVAFQRFRFNTSDPVEASWALYVDDVEWDVVDSLYGAQPSDTVVMIAETPSGDIEFVSGDGVNGKLVTPGASVVATYRVGATVNGNVGAGMLTQSQANIPGLDEFSNAFPADGWKVRDAADAQGRERMRWYLPAQARVARDVVVTGEDAEDHAVNKFKIGSRSPIGRADAVESALDSQVTTLYVLSPGGEQLTADDLESAEEYFNGRLVGLQRRDKRMLSNQQVQMVNATLRSINVSATIEVRVGRNGGIKARAEAALKAYLHPMATDPETGERLHNLAGKVSRTRASNSASAVVPNIAFVDIDLEFAGEGDPSASVQLAAGELPSAGTVVVTVIEVE